MTFNNFNKLIKEQPESVSFSDVISLIETTYHYNPTAFYNGIDIDRFRNEAGTNEGSCKIFAFAKDQNLSKEQTLHCFGSYYRDDVLKHPDATDHANIRTFMKFGWEGIEFESNPLEKK